MLLCLADMLKILLLLKLLLHYPNILWIPVWHHFLPFSIKMVWLCSMDPILKGSTNDLVAKTSTV